MGRLARQQEAARAVAVEGNAVGQEIADALRRFAGDQLRDALIDQPAAGSDGIGRMTLRRVALAHGRGDAALGPDAGRAFAERRGCDDGHRQRREPQRA